MTGRQAKSAMCLLISQHDAFPSAAADEQSDARAATMMDFLCLVTRSDFRTSDAC